MCRIYFVGSELLLYLGCVRSVCWIEVESFKALMEVAKLKQDGYLKSCANIALDDWGKLVQPFLAAA